MNEFITTWNIPSKHGINASVNSSCAQPPPGLPWGICLPFQSQGWDAFANFALHRAFTNPGAIPELFQDTHAVSYQHTQRILLKKKQISSSVKDGVVKACSRFYACISSLLIKPELHRETRELSTWINVFWLVIQISVDIIWRTSFHIYDLFITYNLTAIY